MSQKESEWENATMKAGDVHPDELFVPINIVRILISQREREIVDAIERLISKLKAINDVLSILKH